MAWEEEAIMWLRDLGLGICCEILASQIVRWLTKLIKAEKAHRRWLGWFSRRRADRRTALTRKELLDLDAVKIVDLSMRANPLENKVSGILAENGCITRDIGKDPHFYSTLTLDIEKALFFLAPVLKSMILDKLNPIYDTQRLACIVVLPAPRNSKSRMTTEIELALARCLSSRDIPIEFFSQAIVREAVKPRSIARILEKERVLVLQPVAMSDPYLDHSVSLIREQCVGEIAEVLTLLDPTGRSQAERSTDPPERVLIELDLSG